MTRNIKMNMVTMTTMNFLLIVVAVFVAVVGSCKQASNYFEYIHQTLENNDYRI